MLKAQHELSDALNTHPALNQPLQMGLTLGKTSVATRWSVGTAPDNGLHMTVSENGNTYHLHVPGRADAKSPIKVTVKLEAADGRAAEHVLEGSKLMGAQFEGAFADLHAKVMGYLKKTFGSDLLKALNLGNTAESAASEPASAAAEAQTQPAVSSEDGYSWFRVQRSDQPDLRFKGKLTAYAQSPLRQGRQHVYSVFVTPSGKVVAIKEGLSVWLNERNLAEVQVFDKAEDIVAFFGYSWLAKSLYQQLALAQHAEETLE